jgi:hypothetical protein
MNWPRNRRNKVEENIEGKNMGREMKIKRISRVEIIGRRIRDIARRIREAERNRQ